MLRFCFVFFVAAFISPGAAQSAEENTEFSKLLIDRLIIPGYAALSKEASTYSNEFAEFCESPEVESLILIKERFGELVLTWSRVELIRFGPARKDNRFERIFFWPDRRSRGLRQVQKILRERDDTAVFSEQLQSKSVAVQGLLALDYVLAGAGNDDLLVKGHHRCAYGAAITRAIAHTANGIYEDWVAPDGYRSIMMTPSPDNPIYKTSNEVTQDILRAINESLQIVKDLKIGNALGKSAAAPKPKHAPFWRTNLTLRAIEGNLQVIEAFLTLLGQEGKLDARSAWLPDSLLFELSLVRRRLADAATAGVWVDALHEEAVYNSVSLSQFPLASIHGHLEETLPAALGLTLGFNSLDGD